MSGLYNNGKQALLSGAIALLTDDISAVLIDVGLYTVNYATDTFLSDIPIGARVGTSNHLASKTVSGGIFMAAPAIVASPTASRNVAAIALYKDTGTTTTSPLLLYLDSGAGLPVTTTGTSISLSWSASPTGIFSILSFGGPNWRVDINGNYQIQNADFPGRWHTIVVRGDNGLERIGIGVGVSP